MTKETKINIFKLANANAGNLKKEYQLIIDNCGQEKSILLEGFRNKIRAEWNISINMKESSLMGFMVCGEYKNIFTLKEEQVYQAIARGKIKKSQKKEFLEIALRNHLKEYYESRKIFESSIIHGKKIKYMALNIGGMGIKKPDAFFVVCVVIKKETAESYNTLAFIKEDSLKCFVDVIQKCVLIDKLAQNVSDKECVDTLAVLKHKDEIDTVSSEKFGAMVCSDANYIEAITTDVVSTAQIGYVRIGKRLHDYYFNDLQWKDSISEISKDDRDRLTSFELLLFCLEERGIKWEVIDEN
jgi:hypothetical protein